MGGVTRSDFDETGKLKPTAHNRIIFPKLMFDAITWHNILLNPKNETLLAPIYVSPIKQWWKLHAKAKANKWETELAKVKELQAQFNYMQGPLALGFDLPQAYHAYPYNTASKIVDSRPRRPSFRTLQV